MQSVESRMECRLTPIVNTHTPCDQCAWASCVQHLHLQSRLLLFPSVGAHSVLQGGVHARWLSNFAGLYTCRGWEGMRPCAIRASTWRNAHRLTMYGARRAHSHCEKTGEKSNYLAKDPLVFNSIFAKSINFLLSLCKSIAFRSCDAKTRTAV